MIRHARSRFDLSHGHTTSGNLGTLYPFEVQEVYAGDTFKVKTYGVARLASQFLRPIMGNLFLDMHYFYVPSRLLYDKFPNVFGENTESAWANAKEYDVPVIPAGGRVSVKSVGHYLGCPADRDLPEHSVLPYRAFAKIYNEWFRDQNNIDPMHIQMGDFAQSEMENASAWSPNNYTGMCPKVSKFHDLFTSALPAPQKGEAASISLGRSAPVVFTDQIPVGFDVAKVVPNDLQQVPLFGSPGGGNISGSRSLAASFTSGPTGSIAHLVGTPATLSSAESLTIKNIFAVPQDGERYAYADLTNAQPVTVNDLRFAFQYQKMLEKDARGGTRYVEYIANHFGVQAGDYRLQRSEYLGGKRTPLSIQQVAQTTGSNDETPSLGELGAFSLSNARSRFTKSFVEHGFVIGVFCVRQIHTYQQGLERFWSRTKRTDFYDPVFANIGEQPIYRRELFADVDSANWQADPSVFGYSEAWYDLRFRPNRVSGQMDSVAKDSLDFWHIADEYANAPTLSQGFVEETPSYLDRTISVPSANQDQFIFDFWIQNVAYRPLPTYSVPSLIDHN